jgi:nucleotide-binding universal stress UspA family protein
MFRNILVSVDGSRHADKALAEAIELADCNRARLTILTAVPKPPGWASTPSTAAAAGQLSQDLERESIAILEAAVEQVPNDIPVTKIVTHKPIREALMEAVKSGTHDLLVVGSRGRGAITASLLGSVSHHALHHSPIPVLIVHCAEDQREPAPASPAESDVAASIGPEPVSSGGAGLPRQPAVHLPR